MKFEVTDADYAEQLLTAAEALTPQSVAAVADDSNSDSKVNETDVTNQTDATAMSKVMTEVNTEIKSDDSAVGAMILPTQCLMRDALDLKTQLLLRINVETTVQIDVSKVERIDAAAMQVLLVFVRQRTQHQRKVEWLGINAVMTEAVTVLGLASLLQWPESREAA